ncbi:zinc finger domain-containing protein [Streptomyces sp. bgisy154]|uniref:zinc finger domain-containing protein n=1 Tax=Streptomyces sp. bgisy154 TaxID=3413794 RepID=UPI003D73214F
MTNEEVAVLVRYVRAVCPQQRVDEYTADAWYDVLYPFTVNEARTAIAAHVAAGNAFIAAGEIVTSIRRARADRMARHTDPTPTADPDDVAAYKAELAANRLAVATGQTPPSQHELTGGPMHPDVAARLKTLGTYVPRHVDEALDAHRPIKAARRAALIAGQPDALSVPCDWCHAPAGEPCRSRRIAPGGGATSTKRREKPHPSRVDDAREAMQEQQ